MGHYDEAYEQMAEERSAQRKKELEPVVKQAKDLLSAIRKARMGSRHEERMQTLLFWLQFELERA